jgi:uncharacterized protein (DUF305 family)
MRSGSVSDIVLLPIFSRQGVFTRSLQALFTLQLKMKTTKRSSLTALLLTSTLFLGSAFAQTAMPGMDMSTPKAAASSSMPSMNMGKMATASLEKLSGKVFDRAFLSMMIPHHQAALDMAKAVLPLSKDAQVQTWASGIVKSQQAEISTMTALLRPLGGSEAKKAAMMDGMKGMGQVVKNAKNPETKFVQDMLPHHSSAIDMANLALQRSSDPQVLKLAQDIVLAQAKEMYGFRTWLLK